MTIYSLDVLLFLFGTSLLLHVLYHYFRYYLQWVCDSEMFSTGGTLSYSVED